MDEAWTRIVKIGIEGGELDCLRDVSFDVGLVVDRRVIPDYTAKYDLSNTLIQKITVFKACFASYCHVDRRLTKRAVRDGIT